MRRKSVSVTLLMVLLFSAVSFGVTVRARSIGTNSGVVFSATGAASTNDSRDTVIVAGTEFPVNVGEGDAVTIGGQSGFIASKVNSTTIVLQAPLPTPVSAGNLSVTRVYSDPVAWENAAPANLVTEDIIWKGVCYNDGLFEIERLRFNGSVVDSARYKWLTVAEGQRHRGIEGTGARMSNSYGSSWAAVYFYEDFAKVEWLEIFGVGAGISSGNGIGENAGTNASGKIFINNILLHDVFIGVSLNSASLRQFVLTNSIVTKSVKDAIYGRSAAKSALRCYNVTVVHGATDVDVPQSGFRNCYARNCVAFFYGARGSGHYDFTTCDEASDYNMSYDASAPGSNSVRSVSSTGFFANLSTLDLHLASGSPAIGAGDSTGCSEYAMDIDGEIRTSSWDIGADMHSTIAVEKVNGFNHAATSPVLNISSANPFNNSVRIGFNTSNSGNGVLRIVSPNGKVLFEKQVHGNGIVEWNASKFANGVYVSTLTTGHKSVVRMLAVHR